MAIVDIPNSMDLHRYSMNACDAILPLPDIIERGELFAVSYQVAEAYRKDFEAVVREYSDAHPDTGYLSRDSIRKEFAGMKNVIAALGIALCAIIALIGVLNFINVVVTEMISRKREFAMLQSIGMTDGQLRKMLVWEGICYVGISGIIGIAAGVPLSWTVLGALNRMIRFFDYHFQFLPFLLLLPVLAAVAVLTPMLAFRSLRKKSIVERLREAE